MEAVRPQAQPQEPVVIQQVPAIPDMSDTQVIIRTDFAGQSPQIVEDLVNTKQWEAN